MNAPVPPVDPGNMLLTASPYQLTMSQLQTPAGIRLALTIRTPSTTLTLLLVKADAQAWGAAIADSAAKMNDAGLVVAAPGVPVKRRRA